MASALTPAERVVACFRTAQAIDDFTPLTKWDSERLVFLVEEGGFTGPDLGLLDVLLSMAKCIEDGGGDVAVNRHQIGKISSLVQAGDLPGALTELRKARRK